MSTSLLTSTPRYRRTATYIFPFYAFMAWTQNDLPFFYIHEEMDSNFGKYGQ
jgi:hypothetical protein